MNKFNEAVCRISVPCNQNRSQANRVSVSRAQIGRKSGKEVEMAAEESNEHKL